MSFQQGLSGLNAAAKALDVTGNNIANANTVGFKQSQAQFVDVFAASLAGGSAAGAIGIGTKLGSVSPQMTQGNIHVTDNPLDLAVNGTGFFRMSDNGAITYSRAGQFHLDKDGYIVDSGARRLTGYDADAAGNIVPSAPIDIQLVTSDITPQPTTAVGVVLNLDARSAIPATQTQGRLTGTGGAIAFPLTITAATNDTLNVALNGITGTATIAAGVYNTATALAAAVQAAINAVPGFVSSGYAAAVTDSANVLTITSNLYGNGSSVAITGGTAQAPLGLATSAATAGSDNFSVTDPTSFSSSTSLSVFDSLGNPHVLSLYFVKTAAVNGWRAYANVDGTTTSNLDLGGGAGNPAALAFSTSGALTTGMPLNVSVNLNAVSAALGLTNGAASPLNVTLDLSGTTQFGSAFGVNSITQDGYTSGRLSGMSVGADGVIKARYSNGQARNLGQVVLTNFNNSQGLGALGDNQWTETPDSGVPLVGAPGTGALGVLQALAVEEANVDLTAELVNMITMQRVYQANAQTIKTQDAILQTLVNLR